MRLPLLDASRLSGGSSSERDKATTELFRSLQDHGFARLANHNIPNAVLDELFEWSRKFFELSAEERFSIAHRVAHKPQRGYSELGAEKTSSLYAAIMEKQSLKDKTDAREHFDMGSPNDSQFPNSWPPERSLPGFREFMESFYTVYKSQCDIIMQALERALGLEAGELTDRITEQNGASELRLNHYPPTTRASIANPNLSRIWPHFDLGVITLLFVSGTGGLEIEDRSNPGTFVPLEPESKHELVVNVSETLQRWTNNVLCAGLHRVTFTSGGSNQGLDVLPGRYSVAYFCKADRHASVGSLSKFVGPASKRAYEDITAIEYHTQRLATAY